jgi:hypothetical protein
MDASSNKHSIRRSKSKRTFTRLRSRHFVIARGAVVRIILIPGRKACRFAGAAKGTSPGQQIDFVRSIAPISFHPSAAI